MGDVADEIETAAEHVIATHVHDNRRRRATIIWRPYHGSINWDMALMTMQKIGYDGTYVMELANAGAPSSGSRRGPPRAAAIRAHTGTSMTAYIQDIARHTGQSVTLKGWLHNRRSSGKIHFLTVRDGTGFIQCVMTKQAVGEEAFKQADHLAQETVDRRRRHGARRQPGARRVRGRRHRPAGRVRLAELSDFTEGAWRRLPDGSAPPLDPLAAAAGDPARPPRGDQRRPGFLQRARLHPRRHADLHAGGVRRDDHALPGPVLRRRDRVSDAERPALQRSQRDGTRPRVLLRPDVPRREVEDPPAPHRVLDGRAGDGVRDARRRHGSRRGARRLRRAAGPRTPPAGIEGARTRHVKAREREGAVPASCRTTKRQSCSRRRGCPSNGAATSARRTRPRSPRASIGRSACTDIRRR